jgi:hypothetical protein
MAQAKEAERITRDESVGSAALWFGVLGGPIAWVLHMTIGYSLEEWFACSPSTSTPGEILGSSVPTWAIAITVAFALVASAAGLVAFRCWRRSEPADGAVAGRARWMGMVGLMNSGLYFLIIIGGLGPALMLQVCEASP